MSLYLLDVTHKARRQIKQVLPASKRPEITQAILDLRAVSFPPDSKLERELTERYRLKVNGWRIIYKVNKVDKIVIILSVRKRDKNTYLNVP